jgi:hypothetical protein
MIMDEIGVALAALPRIGKRESGFQAMAIQAPL